MEPRELLDRYEADGDEATCERAAQTYEVALAQRPDDPVLLFEYGYLQECRGRHSIRAAAASYERAIAADPAYEKARHQLIWARAGLSETDEAIALYKERLAKRPDDVAEHRFLASAYLVAREFEEARKVVAAGRALAPDDPRLSASTGSRRPRRHGGRSSHGSTSAATRSSARGPSASSRGSKHGSGTGVSRSTAGRRAPWSA